MIAVSGVHAILMISMMIEVIHHQQTSLMEKAQSQTIQQAELLAASITPQLITDDLAGIDEVLHALRRDKAIRWAAITDAKGLVKGESEHGRLGKYYVDQASARVLKGKVSAMVQETPTMLSAAAPVLMEGEVLGWAWISRDLVAERAQVNQIRRTGYIYTALAIIAGGLLAFFLANQITRQLRLLLMGTQRLAEDRFDVPVPVVTDNDVGVVTRAFNHALMRLDSTRLQLLTTQANLEAEIRERRTTEARLQDANRALVHANEGLTQFAYAVSHDLQEPLRSVTGYSELLQRRYVGKFDQDADEFIAYIHDGAQRMQRMIKALLDYSRAASHEPETRVDVDCNLALAMALENLEITIEATSAKIRALPLPSVCVHEVAVVQLFQNLIGNAIKYAGTVTPEISISAERSERFWTISVRDNGIGIAPEHHKRIFGIFKRVPGKNYPGAGVGLAICTKIVENYGGSISVISEVGRGSEFRFTLPEARLAPETTSEIRVEVDASRRAAV